MTPAGHLEEPFGHSACCPCPALSTASLVQPWDLLTSKQPHSHIRSYYTPSRTQTTHLPINAPR